MARYRGPQTRISRAFGTPIMGNLKVLKKKNYPPGEHGKKRKKKSAFALQLAEKQKAKYIYGILERQFRNYVKKSTREKGVTGDILLQKLERRLDNVVFRLGIAPTRAAARQLVSHKHIQVNGKTINIPSYQLAVGDVVAVVKKSQSLEAIKNSLLAYNYDYKWLSWNEKKMEGVFAELPQREEIPEKINEKSIIELYAR